MAQNDTFLKYQSMSPEEKRRYAAGVIRDEARNRMIKKIGYSKSYIPFSTAAGALAIGGNMGASAHLSAVMRNSSLDFQARMSRLRGWPHLAEKAESLKISPVKALAVIGGAAGAGGAAYGLTSAATTRYLVKHPLPGRKKPMGPYAATGAGMLAGAPVGVGAYYGARKAWNAGKMIQSGVAGKRAGLYGKMYSDKLHGAIRKAKTMWYGLRNRQKGIQKVVHEAEWV